MPKRKNEEEIQLLAKRLRQLEKEIGEARRRRHVSSSSSCSQGSSSSESSSSSSSRDSRAASIDREDLNAQNAAAPAIDEEPALQPVAVRPSNVEPEPGPSNAAPTTAATLLERPATPAAAENCNGEEFCPSELLEILGSDPSQTQEFGEDINKDVASRFEYIATSGLEKQARQDLLDKYLVPSNCQKVAAPQLNAEIKAASNETVVKRDKSIECRQKQLAAAITAVGRMLTSQLKSKENTISKQLMEVGRILCDIQHNDSSTRRNFALYSLKKEFREQLAITKIDKYLFGIDLPETLKTAKAVSKSGTDIKISVQKQKQAAAKLTKNLNWKAGASARSQQKAPTQKQQPAASTSRRHVTSSHRSSHRAKHTRRR